MDETLREYAEYLEKEKKMAENTRLAYQSDVTELQMFLAQRGNDQPQLWLFRACSSSFLPAGHDPYRLCDMKPYLWFYINIRSEVIAK